MQFSLSTIFVTSLALPGVLCAPRPNEFPQGNGITLRLTENGMVQRLAENGTVLRESRMPEHGVDLFEDIAGQPQSRRRDNNVFLAPRDCAIGTPCSEDATCWFDGCDECEAGFCLGSIW